ncbi:MAG: hypothetical protein LUE15_00595, partial [Oscillospiraceae bacterium]|nr:hypothetical protein [Oscillospiraceae bacterium]
MDTHGKLTARSSAERFSGVELLKILAMFIIITSHVVQTISSENTHTALNFDVVSLQFASNDMQQLVLYVMRMGGVNTILFICYAGFLLERIRV